MIFTPEGQDQRIKWQKFRCIVCSKVIIDKPKRKRKVCAGECHAQIIREIMTGAGVVKVMTDRKANSFFNLFSKGYSDRKACLKLNVALSTFNAFCDRTQGLRAYKEKLKKLYFYEK